MSRKKYRKLRDLTDVRPASVAPSEPDDSALLAQLPMASVLEAMPDAIAVYHHTGRFIFLNNVARKLLGDDAHEERLRLPMLERIARLNPRDADGAMLPVERWHVTRLLNGETISSDHPAEMLITTPGGVDCFLTITGAPIVTPEGSILGALVVAHNATEQRLHARALARQSDSKLDIDAAPAHATRELERLRVALDTSPARLSLDDLLADLLDRARALLDAETATLLLADERGESLSVRASQGRTQRVNLRARVPIGQGFAGGIAATRTPRILNDTHHANVVSDYLREKYQAVVGVPLLIENRLLGVLWVGSDTPQEFSRRDVWLLQQIAERAAVAIDRAQLYDALREATYQTEMQARKLEAIIESLAEGIIFFSPDRKTLHANSAYRQMLAIAPDGDQLQRNFIDRGNMTAPRDAAGALLPEEQWPAVRLLRGERMDSAHSQDYWLRAYDGHDALYSVTGGPVYDDHGTFIGAVMAMRDVTELRALERRTQRSLEALLKMAELVVSATSQSGEHISLQQASQRLIELLQQVLGQRRLVIATFDGERSAPRVLAMAGISPDEERQWLFWHTTSLHGDVRLERAPEQATIQQLQLGQPVIINLRQAHDRAIVEQYGLKALLISPMRIGERLVGFIMLDTADQAAGFSDAELSLISAISKLAALVIERDDMLRKQATDQAQTLALAQATQRMDEFLGVAAHELRTPITVIKANLQMLLRRIAHEQEHARPGEQSGAAHQRSKRDAELLERIEKALNRLTRLVDDLLDVSRVRAGKLEMRIARADLADIAREAVVEQRLASPGRVITLALPDSQPMPVLADSERVEQVITNYLTNALKYSSATRPVRVRLWREDGALRLSVTDEGPGIPPESLAEVWVLFHRVPGIEVVSGSGIGLGMGLHLCKTIIERHGGMVGVTSQPGHGSTFWFSLPALDTAAQ